LVPLALTLLGPVVLGQAIDVRSDTFCPSAEQVGERVRQILDLKGRHIDERALVMREAGSLRVVLRGADGRDVGERVLSADAGCEDLAQAVGVVLATWISDVHPEYVATLPSTEVTPGATDAKPPSPTPTPTAHAEGEPAADTSATLPTHDSAPAQDGPTQAPRRLEPGLGVGVGLSGPRAAATVSVVVAWVPAGSGVGLAASATVASPREQPLADGKLQWWRWPATVGLVLRTPAARAIVDVTAGGALAWAHLNGRGFPSTSSADDFTLGAFASVRIAYATGRLVPFAAATGYGWLARSTAYVRPDMGGDLDLPRYDVMLMAGATWRP
jgi:hypothetical protein